MTQPPSPHDDAADLAWLAQQYILGELSPTAAAEFELRLAADEAAGMALVRAVRLHETICTLSPQPLLSSRRPPRHRLLALIASIAAAVAVACFLLPGRRDGLQSGLATLPPQQAAALVSAWRSARPEPVLTPERWTEDDVTDDEVVPEWLLSAVSLESPATDPVQEN